MKFGSGLWSISFRHEDLKPASMTIYYLCINILCSHYLGLDLDLDPAFFYLFKVLVQVVNLSPGLGTILVTYTQFKPDTIWAQVEGWPN